MRVCVCVCVWGGGGGGGGGGRTCLIKESLISMSDTSPLGTYMARGIDTFPTLLVNLSPVHCFLVTWKSILPAYMLEFSAKLIKQDFWPCISQF